jgi:hypothetical protein
LLPDVADCLVETIDMPRAHFRERRGASVMTRGLALTEDVMIVGLSDFSARSVRRNTPSRLMLIDGISSIYRNEKPARCKTIDLGAHGAVMEVRVVNRPDAGHWMPKGSHSPRSVA